jgi:hypothetical protein
MHPRLHAAVRALAALAALVTLMATPGCTGRDALEIRFSSDDTCRVNGKAMPQAELRQHLRRIQADYPKTDLKGVVVLLPWDADEQECAEISSHARKTLVSLGLGSSVQIRKAGNPYLEFLAALIPWVAIAAVVAVAVVVVRRRKTGARARTRIK